MLIPEVNVKAAASQGDVVTAKMRRLTETIERLCHRGANRSIEKLLSKLYPADVASVLDKLPDHYVAQTFNAIAEKGLAAEVLGQVHSLAQKIILSETPDKKLVPVLEKLAPDERAILIREIDPAIAQRLMAELEKSSQQDLQNLLQYAPDTAGGIMTTDYFSLTADMSVEQAIHSVRGHPDVEMIYYLYITDSEERLLGVVSMRQLLLADPALTLGEIMNTRIIKVPANMPRDNVAETVDKYRLLAVPVVDEADFLVGIITVDDVIDVLEDETTRDMLTMAGTSSSELLTQSPLEIFKFRVPWLLAAFLGGVGAAAVLDSYEATLSSVIQLSAFLPIVMGMAGNVGTQAATVAVRGLATGSLKLSNFYSLLFKELSVGFLLGTFYGLLLSTVSWAMFHNFEGVTKLMITVGVAIMMNICLAAVIAASLPMLFQRLGTDPALASGPFVLTSIDVLGVINYLIIASLIFGL